MAGSKVPKKDWLARQLARVTQDVVLIGTYTANADYDAYVQIRGPK